MIKTVHNYLKDNDLLQYLNRVSTECQQSVNTLQGMNKDMDKDMDKVKDKYKEYILLTKEEYNKLVDKFGKPTTEECITRLNNYIGSKGKKYKSHYHTILTWADKDKGKSLTTAQSKTLASLERLGDD